MLRLRIKGNAVESTAVVAGGMEHPNGVRLRGGHLYVTQSLMSKVKDPSGRLVSGVYRFKLDDRNMKVNNTLADPSLISTMITQNESCQYGADGRAFDSPGNLYVGNFGDGAIHPTSARRLWNWAPTPHLPRMICRGWRRVARGNSTRWWTPSAMRAS